MKDKRKLILLSLTLVMFLLISFAVVSFVYYFKDSRNNTLETGLVSIDYTGSSEINLTNQVPVIDVVGLENSSYNFSVKNTSKVPVNLNISLDISENSTIPKENIRYAFYINDELITKSNIKDEILYTYKNFNVDQEINCKLIFWVDYYYDLGGTTFNAKIKVIGESFDNIYEDGTKTLIKTAVSYSVASSSDFSGGLVAINHDGTLYNEKNKTQEIREYRYTGLDVNNYIFLDTNGNGEQDDNEMWRVVGVFKNSNDEWNLKLMRNTVLTSAEIPEIYTYKEENYTLKSSSTEQSAYWNYTNTATNYNDWTTAKLQYFLNGSNGYYGTLSSSIQNIIDNNYTYYLGNWTYTTDTTVLSYTAERNLSNIFSGNQSSWSGSVALLYPSDYGYSASSSYWSETILYHYNSSAYLTSWMQQNAGHLTYEWLLSPSSEDSAVVTYWGTSGDVDTTSTNNSLRAVRPVINLIANFGSLQGSGTESDPYKLA